jgi:uncharacterized protein YwqG
LYYLGFYTDENQMKPTVSLWSMGEPKFQALLEKALGQDRIESEQRVYRITKPNAPDVPTGAIITYGATQTITPKLKSLFLMACSYFSELVVLVTGCSEIKSDEALDKIESNIRRNLSAVGFDGDSTPFIRCQKTPTQAHLKDLLARLDEKNLVVAPRTTPSKLPKSHENAPLAQGLLTVHSMLRISGRVSLVSQKPKDLFAGPITTQFCGMPYLETKESWPSCPRCRAPLSFLFQLNAAEHLKPPLEKAGLYVFYLCRRYEHGRFNLFVTKHYPAPSSEKRQPISNMPMLNDGADPNEAWGVEVSYVYEVPSRATFEYNLEQKKFWDKLASLKPKKRSGDWYDEIVNMLQLNTAEFADPVDKITEETAGRTTIGGYMGVSESTSNTPPTCKKCKREMRILFSVGYNSELPFFDYDNAADLQFFVCQCSVSVVTPVVITVDDDFTMTERYEVSIE